MNNLESQKPSLRSLGAWRRRDIRLSQEEWVKTDYLQPENKLPLVAQPAIDGVDLRHPRKGGMVWFNQAHLFHVSRLTAEVRGSLLLAFEEKDLPRNVYYGDGSPIEASVLDEICKAYEQEAVTFPWQEGDILMLDNMLTAHGRRPFVGQRNVVVGMTEPFGNKTDSAG